MANDAREIAAIPDTTSYGGIAIENARRFAADAACAVLPPGLVMPIQGVIQSTQFLTGEEYGRRGPSCGKGWDRELFVDEVGQVGQYCYINTGVYSRGSVLPLVVPDLLEIAAACAAGVHRITDESLQRYLGETGFKNYPFYDNLGKQLPFSLLYGYTVGFDLVHSATTCGEGCSIEWSVGGELNHPHELLRRAILELFMTAAWKAQIYSITTEGICQGLKAIMKEEFMKVTGADGVTHNIYNPLLLIHNLAARATVELIVSEKKTGDVRMLLSLIEQQVMTLEDLNRLIRSLSTESPLEFFTTRERIRCFYILSQHLRTLC